MVKAHANLRVRERGSRGKAFWALDFMFLLPESAWAKRHPEAAGHGAKGIRTPRHSRRTGLDKQKKGGKEEGKVGKCEVQRDEGRKKEDKRPEGARAGGEGVAARGGESNPRYRRLFLNLLGVCGSNKDKGGNDYSVKSMVLD